MAQTTKWLPAILDYMNRAYQRPTQVTHPHTVKDYSLTHKSQEDRKEGRVYIYIKARSQKAEEM